MQLKSKSHNLCSKKCFPDLLNKKTIGELYTLFVESEMDEKEYQTIQAMRCKGETITASDVEEITEDEVIIDRTLLFGVTSAKIKWHIYFKEGKIHKLIYANNTIITHRSYFEVDLSELIPSSGKLYPECCDYQFCALLINMGIELSFTHFDYEKRTKIFYGKVEL